MKKIERNPARGVRRLADVPRDRRLTRVELDTFGAAIRTAEADGEHPTGLAAIRFLLLTGFRRMEGLALQREWLHEEGRSVRFPDTKSGAQIRVIGRAAVELLLAQPQTAQSPFFFPADRGEGHFIGVVRVLDRVCAIAGLNDVTPHTLRHTFASVAGDLGFSELTIAALLGHVSRGVTQRYVHIDEAVRMIDEAVRMIDEAVRMIDEAVRMAADEVAGEIAMVLGGGAHRRRAAEHRAALPESALKAAGSRGLTLGAEVPSPGPRNTRLAAGHKSPRENCLVATDPQTLRVTRYPPCRWASVARNAAPQGCA